MKKIIISLAVMAVAVAVMVSMLSRSNFDFRFEANVEVLSAGEEDRVSVCLGL